MSPALPADVAWPFGYKPNTPVAVAGVILFFVLVVCHTFFYFKQRSWFFLFMIMGICLYMLALFLRIPTGEEVAASFVATHWAPSIIVASIHMTFNRLLWFITPHSKLNWRLIGIPPRWFALVFVFCDFFALLVMLLGSASYTTSNNNDNAAPHPASKTLAYGLAIQAVVLVAFAATSLIFTLKSKRWNAVDSWKLVPGVKPQWQRLLLAVNVANGLLLFRTIFGMIAAFGPASASPNIVSAAFLNYEALFWCFDAVPVFVVCGLFLAFHPGHYLPRRFTGFRMHAHELRREKEQTERGEHLLEVERGAAPLFKDASGAPVTYELPKEVPRAYCPAEREHPAFA